MGMENKMIVLIFPLSLEYPIILHKVVKLWSRKIYNIFSKS